VYCALWQPPAAERSPLNPNPNLPLHLFFSQRPFWLSGSNSSRCNGSAEQGGVRSKRENTMDRWMSRWKVGFLEMILRTTTTTSSSGGIVSSSSHYPAKQLTYPDPSLLYHIHTHTMPRSNIQQNQSQSQQYQNHHESYRRGQPGRVKARRYGIKKKGGVCFTPKKKIFEKGGERESSSRKRNALHIEVSMEWGIGAGD
jgi:hypothetical protein